MKNNNETTRYIVESKRKNSAPGLPGAVSCSQWQVVQRYTRPIVYLAADVAIGTISLSLGRPLSFDIVRKIMLEKVVALSSVISMVCVVILLYATSPSSIGPLGIFILFILMYTSILGVLTFSLFFASKVIIRSAKLFNAKRPIQPLSFVKSYYYSSVLSLVPVMIIGLQSVGEVGFYEVLLILFFVTFACVYVSKRIS